MIKTNHTKLSQFFLSTRFSYYFSTMTLTKADNSLKGRLPPLASLVDMSIDKTWQSININFGINSQNCMVIKKIIFTFDIAQNEQYIKVSKYTQIKKSSIVNLTTPQVVILNIICFYFEHCIKFDG